MYHGHRFYCHAVAALVALCTFTGCSKNGAVPSDNAAESPIERGRYLVKMTGCNDCHTPGYIQSLGKVPEENWLTGTDLGWRGPWGTTYGSNLRLYMSALTEDGWVKVARTAEFRPPMPWFALHEMKEEDLRAIHAFITHLGPAGEPAPLYVPPGREPKTPYVLFPGPPE